MSRKLYVANISCSGAESELQQLFSTVGTIETINVVTDRDTGRPRGFAFVQMTTHGEAAKAIAELDQRELGDRRLTVREARPTMINDERDGRSSESRFVTAFAV